MMPKFTISILAMGGRDMTQVCIESVLKSVNQDFELILTNNASDDDTGEYFESLKSTAGVPVRVIHNTENKGFSDPNNHALTLARGEYFVTLNNDTEVPPNWLDHLLVPFAEDPKCAITGGSGTCNGFKAPYPSFHGSPTDKTEYIEGSCLCIPTKLAREITLFAPYLYFAYGEDVDLSLRVRSRGMTIHQAPFTIKHIRRATSKNLVDIGEIQKQNHVKMIDRWGNYLKFRKFDLPIVIRRTEALGDILLTSPLIRALHQQCPASEIFVETNHPEMVRDLPGVKAAGPRFPQVYKWARLIDLDMSYENMTCTHIVDAYFKKALIIPPPGDNLAPELNISVPDRAFANSAMDGGQWVAVHVGPSTWAGKHWPLERWVKVCQWLLDQPLKVVLVGSDAQPQIPNYLDIRGRATPQQTAAVIAKCDFFVGIDSLPIHLAQAVGIPVIGLFGATRPEYILNRELPAISLCADTECAGERHLIAGTTYTPCHGECMQSISVREVTAACERAIS
jgi:ADP-heptose:LPS heptosyltransferase/GT2 family glycosyltransferase